MVFELQGARGVGDPFDRVRDRVRVVVGRIDAPRIAGAMMRRMANAVERRIAHVDVRRRHVDSGAQHVCAVGKLSGAHPPEQVEVLLRTPLAIWTVPSWLGERTAVVANLVGRQAVDVRLSLANQLLGVAV